MLRLGALLGAFLVFLFVADIEGRDAAVIVQQPGPQIVEYCIREFTLYDDDDTLTLDGPNRDQIVGARVDFRPDFGVPPKHRQWGLFAYSVPQTGADILLCVPAQPTRELRDVELTALSMGFDNLPLAPGNFSEVMFAIATVHGDTQSTLRPPSLRPNLKTKRLSLYLGDGALRSERFDMTHPAAAKVREAYGETYRQILQQVLGNEVKPGSHQRYLGFLESHFRGLDARNDIIPDDLPKVSPLRPETTITDAFDGGAVGNLGDDFNENWTQISLSTTCDVVVQSGDDDYVSQNFNEGTCEAFLADGVSTDDHDVEGTYRIENGAGTNQEFTAFVRKACGNVTETWYSGWWDNDGNETRIRERTAGSAVTLASGSESPAINTDYVLTMEANGSDLEFFIDAVSELTASDGSITGNLCGGIRLRNQSSGNNTTVDDFTLEDLGAAAPRRIFIFWPF